MDVLLLGFKDAGKTSFVDALSEGDIRDDTIPTLSMRVSTVHLHKKVDESQMRIVDENTALLGDNYSRQQQIAGNDQENMSQLVMKVYDLSGQARNRHLWNEFMSTHASRLNCIVYMVDISDSLTLQDATDRLVSALLYDNDTQQVPFVILFNKVDLIDDLDTILKKRQTSVSSDARRVKPKRASSRSGRIDVHNRRAKLLLNSSLHHQMIMDYLGISMDNGKIYIESNGSQVELLLDIGLFMLSLKDLSGDAAGDSFESVIDWIVGDV